MSRSEPLVVLRRGALGDVVLIGAVQVNRPVTLVTDPKWAPLMERMRGIDHVRSWMEPLPSGEIVDLQRSPASLRRWVGSRRGRMIRKHTVRRWSSVLGWRWSRPSVEALYASAMGGTVRTERWLCGSVHGERRMLTLAPGSSTGLKRWPSKRYRELAKRWSGPVSVIGTPLEATLLNAVGRGIPHVDVVIDDGFEHTVTVLSRSQVLVCNDSAWSHMGRAAGTSVVTILGPTWPGDGFVNSSAVWSGVSCSPCTRHRRNTCRMGDHRCMESLSVETVWTEVRRCAGQS